MNPFSRVILLFAVLTIGHAIPAFGQAADDLKVERIRQEHPEGSYLFFDLTLLIEGKPGCTPASVELTTAEGKQATARFEVYRPNPLFSNKSESRGSFIALRPAIYTISFISCEALRTHNFKGQVAQIRVDPGEIINAGNLVLDMSVLRKGQLFTPALVGAHSKVIELSAETLEAFRKRAPETFAKAKRRPFTIVLSAAQPSQ